MEFPTSTQAASWLFDEGSLRECRLRAVSAMEEPKAPYQVQQRVRKFASGFHRRREPSKTLVQTVAPDDQEILVKFHSHQMQMLIGPSAIFDELRTSHKVLSTAIMLFRRFYLSNSVVEISPRKMAVASAFFAAKAEEQKVEVSFIMVRRYTVSASLPKNPWLLFGSQYPNFESSLDLKIVTPAEILCGNWVRREWPTEWQFRRASGSF